MSPEQIKERAEEDVVERGEEDEVEGVEVEHGEEDVVFPPPKRKKQTKKKRKSKRMAVVEMEEEDRDPVSGEDCEVVGDKDCEEVRYADELPIPENAIVVKEGEVRGSNEGRRLGIDVEDCANLEAEFGEVARDDDNVSDADSGDDIWDNKRIPNPLEKSDDEEWSDDEDEDESDTRPSREDPEEILKLGKKFNYPEDLKLAVLRYSLHTEYDVKLYKSQGLKIGVKC